MAGGALRHGALHSREGVRGRGAAAYALIVSVVCRTRFVARARRDDLYDPT
ncbi:hypothetical protein STRAU_4148 [Streptomyces aurantiacus JA 4570]|uniref:Uncharacterized protein n=1 Tax=Streptomyces aurantiacus JA 4570 TaxID=1286094 RepID=S3ZGK2_9ACTN|nr:hypothetical protein STRAU_4148 [Streptomyces aurantiacus JA 4570]